MLLAINTDLTITVEKLIEILGDKDNGNWLELPESKVNKIKISYDSPFRRTEAYLDLYATHHPCPSWKHVAESLRSIGLVRQAGEVKNTYIQGTCINIHNTTINYVDLCIEHMPCVQHLFLHRYESCSIMCVPGDLCLHIMCMSRKHVGVGLTGVIKWPIKMQ